MRYIIEKENDQVFISAGKPLRNEWSVFTGKKDYPIVYSTSSVIKVGETYPLTQPRRANAIVTKHYKSFEEMMIDYPELFL